MHKNFKKLFSWVTIVMIVASQTPLGSMLGTVGTASADITSITITAPDGGELLRGTTDITWTSDDIGNGLVDIYYCKGADCFSNPISIAGGEANDGSYSRNTSAIPQANDYKIIVSKANTYGTRGASADYFGIDNTNPTVDAGADRIEKALFGHGTATASDTNGIASYLWSKESGDGTITFGSPTSLGTTITASAEGTYVIKLLVTDTFGNTASDTMQLIRDVSAPTVNVGSDMVRNTGITISPLINGDIAGIASYLWVNEDSGQGNGTYIGGVTSANLTITNFSVDGTYTLGLLVTDNAGNTGYDTLEFTWDTTSPTISITNPNTSPATSKTVTASVSDGTLTMTVGDTSTTCNNTRTFGAYSSTTFSSESDNGKYICYQAVDGLGNTGYSLSNQIAGIDTTAPTYTKNEGTDAGPTKLDTINVTVNEDNGISSLHYGFSSDNTCDGADTYGNSFSNSTNFSIAGDHTDYLCLRAIDTAGNTSYYYVGQLNTDNTAPSTPTISTPITTPSNDSTPTLGITVSEANGQSIKIYSGGVLFQTILSPTNGANSITLNDVGEGVHGQFSATFTDQAGNESSSSTLGTFTVDLTAPVVSLTALSPDPTNDNTVTLNGNVTDNLTNIVSVEYSLNGGTNWIAASATDTFNSTSEGYTFTTSALANGSWTVIVRSTDDVGNVTTSYATDSFVVDNTTPVINNLNVTVNSSSSITVAGLATNPGPTSISAAEYYIDTPGSTALTLGGGTTSRNYNGTIDISGLSNGTHTIYVKVQNEASTRSTYSSQSFSKVAAGDTTAPTLSSPSVTPTKTTAAISFTSNEAGSAKIAYGLSNSYGNTTQYSTISASSNTITLAGLSCGTTYHYTIFAKDAAGNENNNLGDATFSTTACDAAVEITSLFLSDLGSTSTLLNYTTDTTPDSAQYRVSTIAYNGTRTTLTASPFTIGSLTAGRTYYYQVRFTKNGQTTTSNPMSFKTASASDGIKVNSIERILNGNTPTPGASYASGYHFRFDITVNDMSRDTLQFKLSNRSNAASTMAVANNTKIVVSEDGVDVDTDESAETITAADTYTDGMNISSIDADDNLGGKQIKVDMFYKIPSGSQGVFSTSYGMQASTTEIPE